ncbi:BaiN/RdsA family NAD(P)/FAD-dependent oxidoreductase [Derxia lacustris]|uniref:NAD(P)/FAD-dependent oxidoreductase n=1 Tax=Derxia lacustris TaxID=764842 RepID=UPI000A177EBC|nr:NAD(P)/FAD-dependent oxidoreductase [Derxia lacustris]
MNDFDAIVIGAGAAGLMCAAVAGQRGARVLLLDHAGKLAEKIRISGGGRCNFTNLGAGPGNYLSQNPHFARSALARYTPADFIALMKRHRIGFHEKHRGQLFCDGSSEEIIAMLDAECAAGGVDRRMGVRVAEVRREAAGAEAAGAASGNTHAPAAGARFIVATDAGEFRAPRVVVATGGPSIPKIGATDFGYRIARGFGLKVVDPRPALVPLTFSAEEWRPFAGLAGIACEVGIACGDGHFTEDLLFTHRGLSGPAVLQISSYWRHGDALAIDLVPTRDAATELLALKRESARRLGPALAEWLPRRLTDTWLDRAAIAGDRRLAECADSLLRDVAARLSSWTLTPDGSEGWRKAEVALGGVDTRELSQASMESRRIPGLHFVGEVVDVTGWLGGYNFQWAWASGVAAGMAISA